LNIAKGRSKVSSTVFSGINFVLDRNLSEVDGGIDAIKAKIVNNDGAVRVNIFKIVSEYGGP